MPSCTDFGTLLRMLAVLCTQHRWYLVLERKSSSAFQNLVGLIFFFNSAVPLNFDGDRGQREPAPIDGWQGSLGRWDNNLHDLTKACRPPPQEQIRL